MRYEEAEFVGGLKHGKGVEVGIHGERLEDNLYKAICNSV